MAGSIKCTSLTIMTKLEISFFLFPPMGAPVPETSSSLSFSVSFWRNPSSEKGLA